jgi:hypothetical protein
MNKANKILYWFYRLSWKKISALGVFLLILAVVPVSLNVALSPTRTRSEAALLPQPQPSEAVFEMPTGAPRIFLVDHFFGKVGDAVLIHGENLGGLHENCSVSLSGQKIAPDNLVSWTGSYIEFKVPGGAKSGPVEVNILGKKALWDGTFFVVDETTEAELRLEPNQPTEAGAISANLTGKGLKNGRDLTIWLLIMAGEGNLEVTPAEGVSLNQSSFALPIGKIYELRLRFTGTSLTSQSLLKFVKLAKITKTEEMLVGLAKAELVTQTGELVPLQVHPLYVSF